MALFGLFSKKSKSIQPVKVEISTSQPIQPAIASISKPKEAIKQLLLLSRVDGKRPVEWTTAQCEDVYCRYGIDDVNSSLKRYEELGLIRKSTVKESIENLRLSELKKIGIDHGIKISGKKDTMCKELGEQLSESVLSTYVTDTYYIRTEEGQKILDASPVIQFYTGKKPYSLSAVDIPIDLLENLSKAHPSMNIRDIIWGEFNKKSLSVLSQAERMGHFYHYSKLLYTMALFVEEDAKFKTALSIYIRYIYNNCNVDPSMAALFSYREHKSIKSASDTLFFGARILPAMTNDLSRLINECKFNNDDFRALLLSTFEQESKNINGLISPEKMTDFVIRGLNSDIAGEKEICIEAAQIIATRL